MLMSGDFLQHLHHIWPCVNELGLSAQVDVKDFSLTVSGQDKILKLWPQFSSYHNGKLVYMPYRGQAVRNFIGWRPYAPKSWPLGTNKLQFKDYLQRCGIRTPLYSRDAAIEMSNVLVKKNRSSFSAGIRGPFRAASMVRLDAETEEYYEAFIEGKIVKIWFWNAEAIAAEVVEPRVIVGNGKSSLGELLDTHAITVGTTYERAYLQDYVAFRNLTFETVLAAGERCAIDYRYNSPFSHLRQGRDVRIGADPFFNLENELKRLGPLMWTAIPQAIRQDTVYCVDGVIDAQERLWLLEMNANPYVHPYVYRAMLQSCLGKAQKIEVRPALRKNTQAFWKLT